MIHFFIRCAWALVAMAIGSVLVEPSIILAQAEDDEERNGSVLTMWLTILALTGIFWGAVYLTIKGIG